MVYLLVFIGGFCLTLVLSLVALRHYLDRAGREDPFVVLLTIFLTLLTPILALVGGGVCVLLYTLWQAPSPHIRLLCLGILLLLAFLMLGSLALGYFQKQYTLRMEAREERRHQATRRQESLFLTDYARLFEAIQRGDIEQTRALLALGMPYTRGNGSAPHYNPAVTELTLALRGQEDPRNPLYTISPLEAAVRAGNADIVRLLLAHEGADNKKALRHQRAIAEANVLQREDLAALIQQYA